MEKLNNIVRRINDMLVADKQNKYPYHKYATANLNLLNVSIEVWLDSSSVEVTVYRDNGREYPNIESYISEHIVDYDSIDINDEDEWSLNGFRNETDYLNYKYG